MIGIIDDTNIYTLLNNYYSSDTSCNEIINLIQDVDIQNWNTSLVTDVSGLFTLNISVLMDISEWDVGDITSGNNVNGFNNFNQDISYGISNVTSGNNV